jgi:hypothetical protein
MGCKGSRVRISALRPVKNPAPQIRAVPLVVPVCGTVIEGRRRRPFDCLAFLFQARQRALFGGVRQARSAGGAPWAPRIAPTAGLTRRSRCPTALISAASGTNRPAAPSWPCGLHERARKRASGGLQVGGVSMPRQCRVRMRSSWRIFSRPRPENKNPGAWPGSLCCEQRTFRPRCTFGLRFAAAHPKTEQAKSEQRERAGLGGGHRRELSKREAIDHISTRANRSK